MRPFLFNIGELQIPSFFFMVMVGTLAMVFYCFFVAGRVGLRREFYLDMGMLGLLAGVLGARIFHILVEAPDYYWENPTHIFEFWRGGFVSFGAYIMAPLVSYLYLRIRKVPVWPYLDVLALGTPLLQFSIRMACLLAGCCYGKPTDVPWSITFSNPSSTAYYYLPNIPLHPTQVYSMIHAMLLFVFVNIYYFKKKNRAPGEVVPVMFLGYLIPRGVIEFWRADIDRGMWFGELISTGQIMSLLGVIACIALFFYLRRNLQRSSST